jgi:hypothetical protein
MYALRLADLVLNFVGTAMRSMALPFHWLDRIALPSEGWTKKVGMIEFAAMSRASMARPANIV